MRRIIKEKDDIKVSIFSGGRLVRVFIDSGYRNIAMVIADCGRIANGCYHIHHIEVVNMDNIITNADGVKVKVRVYDFGDEVADRYTIVYVNKNIKDGYGVVYYPVFSCSEDPFHPLGVGMYAGDYYPHRSHMYNFGKRVKDIDSLPKKVIEFIKYITR